MEKYYPPEGFIRDKNSNLYYQKLIGTDENGVSVQYVTWFDAETGEYSQHQYPNEPISAEPNISQEARPMTYKESQVSDHETKVKSQRADGSFLKKLFMGIGGVAALAVLCFSVWKAAPLLKGKMEGSTEAGASGARESGTISAINAKGETEDLLLALVPYLEAEDYEGAATLIKTKEYTQLIQNIKSGQYMYADAKAKNKGIAAYSNGYFYYGTWTGGVRAGLGCYINGQTKGRIYDVYSGEWMNNLPNGKGTVTVVNEPTPYEEDSNSTTADKTTVTGTFTDGLQSGQMKNVWYMNDGEIHEWSPITAVNGIYQEAEIPEKIAEREYVDENQAAGKIFVAYDINTLESDLWDNGYMNAVGGLEEIIGNTNEEIENPATNTDKDSAKVSQNENVLNEVNRWDGVYQGDGFTIVFASEGIAAENCTSDYHIVVDMGYDVFFPRTALLTEDNLIEDRTRKDNEIITELSFRLSGDTLQYYRLIRADGYEDNITLIKTSEDPLMYYEKYVKQYSDDYKGD